MRRFTCMDPCWLARSSSSAALVTMWARLSAVACRLVNPHCNRDPWLRRRGFRGRTTRSSRMLTFRGWRHARSYSEGAVVACGVDETEARALMTPTRLLCWTGRKRAWAGQRWDDCWSSFATARGQGPHTLAWLGGCFANAWAAVSAGVRGGSRAPRRVVTWAGGVSLTARSGLRGPLSGPGGRDLVPVELQQIVGGGG